MAACTFALVRDSTFSASLGWRVGYSVCHRTAVHARSFSYSPFIALIELVATNDSDDEVKSTMNLKPGEETIALGGGKHTIGFKKMGKLAPRANTPVALLLSDGAWHYTIKPGSYRDTTGAPAHHHSQRV